MDILISIVFGLIILKYLIIIFGYIGSWIVTLKSARTPKTKNQNSSAKDSGKTLKKAIINFIQGYIRYLAFFTGKVPDLYPN